MQADEAISRTMLLDCFVAEFTLSEANVLLAIKFEHRLTSLTLRKSSAHLT